MQESHSLIRPQSKEQGRADEVQNGMSSSSSKDVSESAAAAPAVEPEETRKPQIARRPNAPTKAEIEEHLPLHLEYRSWCPHCVAGKGISNQHRQNLDGHSGELGSTVSLDYCFMTANEEEEDMRAILVGYDHERCGFGALPVERKGAQEEVVKWIVDRLRSL